MNARLLLRRTVVYSTAITLDHAARSTGDYYTVAIIVRWCQNDDTNAPEWLF